MPYYISDKQDDCSGWATVKENADGSYETIGCHDSKQGAVDQMIAVSISEDMEPGGEIRAVDLSVPQFIRDNAARGLKYLQEGFGGDGLTDATKREAREMAAGRVSENKVRKMAPWFARHKVDGQAPKNNDPSNSQYPGAGLVAWLLWGGDSNFSDKAQNWAQRKIDALDAEETRKRDSNTVVIVDVDGTVLNGSEGIQKNIDFVNELGKTDFIHIVTGRLESDREKTANDLRAAGLIYNALTLNNTDMASPEYKKATAEEILKTKEVKLAIDNGESARAAYQSLGIETMNPSSISESANSRSKMKKIERRTFVVRDVEARQAEDGTMRLAGYAAVFNDSSVPLPFKESIAPGAFRKTLSETPDVRLLVNHEGLPLARTKNGTLTLTEDERGLYFSAELADTQEARDIHTLIARGDVDQMSFAFRVIRQKWSEDRSRRVLTEVSLSDGDVSVVTYPAYPTTTVEAREHLMEAIQTIKEGRTLDGESLLVVQAVLDKVTEAYDYLEEGKSMIEQLVGMNPEMPEEVMPEEVAPMAEDSSRTISLRLARAIVNNTK
ncbi:Prohead protease [uncultured Caudovirales phage]|uniref:Prohead protease n=1 Tax=uncultured Caudovirales phage TaxID=2100421 RepID=A0A6J5NAI8_9CAUD|nr:Prohead protease [uncultured Caudovirales phage]